MGRNNYKKASAPIMRTAAHSCDPVVLPDSPSPPHLLYIHGVDLGLLFWEELMRKKNGTPATGSSWAGSVGFCRIKNAMPTIKGSTTDQSSEGDIERAAN